MPTDDPFAAFGGHAVTTTSQTQQSQPSQEESTDPFASFGGHATSTATGTTTGAPTGSTDPFAAFGGRAMSAGGGEQRPADGNAPWYEKAWDWANTPLVDLHRWDEPDTGGFRKGAEDVASGFTSPLSIALTIGTFGAGPALEALGLTARELPAAVQGVRALVDAGFTAQQVIGTAREVPQLTDALKEGNTSEAERLLVGVGAGALFGGLGVRGTMRDAGEFAERTLKNKPSEETARIAREADVRDGELQAAGNAAKIAEETIRKAIPDATPQDLGAIFRHIEAGGDKENLRQKINLLATSADKPEWRIEDPDATQQPSAVVLGGGTASGKSTAAQRSGGAGRRLSEIADQQNLKKNYAPKELDDLHAKYLQAYQGLTPEQLRVADMVRRTLNDSFARAQQNNVISSFVEDYLTHIWDLEKEPNAAASKLLAQARTGNFATNVSMARKRVFDSSFEGELLGKHLKTDDPIAIAAHHVNTVRRAIANRDFIERLRDLNVRMPDKQPIVAISGRGDRVDNDKGEATLVNPNRVRNIRIAKGVVEDLRNSGDLERFLEEKKIVEFNEPGKQPVYAWNPAGYVNLDHPAFRDWIFAAHDSGGKPVHVKGDMLVHPDAAEYLKRRLGLDRSQLRENKVGGALLRAGGEAKNVLLSFSPFHVAQEALRALMTGVNPIGVEKFNIDADPLLRELVEHHLTLGRDMRGIEDYTEGVGANSKLIGKIPIARDVQSWLNSFLFDKYIPGLKVRAARSLAERYRQAYPEWTHDHVLTAAAEHTNEVFGGINYKALGRSAAAQDWFRMAALAPDWLESELRFTARLFGEEGKIARHDVMRMAAGLWATARVLNYLSTGQAHNEAPFGVVSKDKDGREKVYSVRTLPTDILHLASDPMGFLRGRISPLGRAGMEVLSGRDQSGRKLTPQQTFVDVLRNAAPIPAQAIGAAASGQAPAGFTSADQAFKSSLGTVSEYKTAAEQKADQIASDHNEQGPLDQEKLRVHQTKMRFEDQLHMGQMQPQDVYRMVERGQIPVEEAKEIIRNANETKGMSPETARLYTRSLRLPMKDFLDVWGVSTDEQKAALSKLLLRKRQSYIKSAIKEMTPAQRAADPTYRKLRAIFPNLPPW